MEDASPVSKEDASSGSLPAEKKSGAQPSEKKTSGAAGEPPDAAIDDLSNETFSNAKAEEAGTFFSHAFSSACWNACRLGVAHLRIACGVCLLAVAGVLLCIAAAAALSVYGGYDFTEGVVGQFMSSRVAPVVTQFTRHPWLRGVPSSATIAAAIAAVLVTAGVLAASLPLLQCRAPAPLHSRGGWAQSSRRAVSACLRRCRLTLRSPLLLLPRGGGRCRRSGSGSLPGGTDRGERRRGAAAVAPAGCCSSGGGAGAGWEAAASSSAAAAGQREGGGASQRVDGDSGRHLMHSGAAAAGQNEKIEGRYTGGRAAEIRQHKAGAVYGAQQSVRHSLQILPWWSAPLLRLKQVIRSFLHIVAAKLRGPEATEASILPPRTGGAAAATAAAAGGGPARAAAGGPGAFTSGLAAGAGAGAAAKPATATPRAAAGGPPATTGAAAADLRVAGRKTSAEAEGGAVAAGDKIETRRGAHDGERGDTEKKNERESRPMMTFGGAEGRSTGASPRRRRSRDAVSAAQSGKTWDSTAAAVAAMHTVQQVKHQERNVSAKERGRTVEGSPLSEEERKARVFPPVADGHRSSRPNGDAAAAGRRGDSESSSGGSLQGESEVEDWLVLQEADGRRK